MQFSYRSQIKIKLAKENSNNNNRGSLSFVHKQILMNLKKKWHNYNTIMYLKFYSA